MDFAQAIPIDFHTGSRTLGLELNSGDLDRLGAYLALLFEGNAHMSLTAIRDPETAWTRHILDSLSLVPLLASTTSERVIDVGSGGGLPGIPLAIVLPETRFTLLEATGKKARFLSTTVESLGLDNVRVVNDRAETAAAPGSAHRAAFDVVLARALGPLPVLLELTVPLARVDGVVAAIKGERAADEIEAAGEALIQLKSAVIDTMSTSTGTIVMIRKLAATPRTFPRRPGEPKRRPIGSPELRGTKRSGRKRP